MHISATGPAFAVAVAFRPPARSRFGFAPAGMRLQPDDAADAAWAAGVSIFPVFFNRAQNGADSAFLASLTRGKGIFSETPIAAEMSDLAAAVCVAMKVARLVD